MPSSDIPKYPDNVVWKPQAGSQEAFLSAGPINEVLLQGSRGGGKSIANDTLVLTNRGWVEADQVSMEDQLVAQDGSYTKILGIYPQPLHEKMYEVFFNDYCSVIVSGDHLWKVKHRWRKKKNWHIVSTLEMLSLGIYKGTLNTSVWSIPYMENPYGGKIWRGYDPYLLGLIAGDGWITRSKHNDGVRVGLSAFDPEIQVYALDKGWSLDKEGKSVYPLVIESRKIAEEMWECNAGPGKKIPSAILKADAETRLACLQGLMDSDGSIDKNGQCSFSSISFILLDQVTELVRSLGGRARLEDTKDPGLSQKKDGYIIQGNHPGARVRIHTFGKFCPFRISKKKYRLKDSKQNRSERHIIAIVPRDPVPHRCFFIEHSSHCFIIQGHTVTHNTDCLLMSFGMYTGRGFGSAWRGVLFRQTYKQLGDVINKTKQWFPRIWPGVKFNGTNHSWEWVDGEMLLLRSAKNESSYWDFHGHEYPWIGFEELANWPNPNLYKRMFSCNRSSKPGMPRMIRSTTNPYGVGHNWIKMRFLPDTMNMKVRKNLVDSEGHPEPPRLSIFSRLEENKILLAADPDYISKIAASARSKAELKAWLEGSWDIVAGGMFDDVWDPDYNIVQPFEIPWNWRIDRSFDWGSSRPFSVGWWATATGEDVVLPDGRYRSTIRGDLYRIEEWYGMLPNRPNEGQKLLASEISEGIVARELKLGYRDIANPMWSRVKSGVADNSIFTAENGNCIALDMSLKVRLDNGIVFKGIQWVPADKSPGSRVTGWDQMRRMLKNAHPSKLGPREKPGLFVFDRCHDFIRTVPVLPRDENDPDDIDDEAEDHIADETRYRVRATGLHVRSGRTTGMY